MNEIKNSDNNSESITLSKTLVFDKHINKLTLNMKVSGYVDIQVNSVTISAE